MTLSKAIDVFGLGFARTRSATTPYEYLEAGPLRLLRDVPGTRKTDPRNAEVLVPDLPPDQAIPAILALKLPRYAVCAIHRKPRRDPALEAAYKAAGFRLMRTEPFFARETTADPEPTKWNVSRFRDAAEVARAERQMGVRQGRFQDPIAEDPPIRVYAAWDGDTLAGSVQSVEALPDSRWVASLFVDPAYRRQGLGAALMRAMLADDARLGYRWSVLLASHAGAQLYPKVGYRQIGLLELFAPPKTGKR